ncbi:hypothetical protein L7F22_006482 [Adiantum nelumboides]|nr:hypothetical protein [Adiantum nelumboides]
MRFEEAIASDKIFVAEAVDYQTIQVEPSYTGARIEGDSVTLDFIMTMMEDFKQQKKLHKRYAFQILLQIRKLLLALPSLVDITVPDNGQFTICGDIHGQMRILIFSMEILLTARLIFCRSHLHPIAFKCRYPQGIYLARGNHESKSMNKIYGFEGEVKAKFNERMVDLFAEVFCCLPLAHVLNGKVFVGMEVSLVQMVSSFLIFVALIVLLSRLMKVSCILLLAIVFVLFVPIDLYFPYCRIDVRAAVERSIQRFGGGPKQKGVAVAFGSDVTKRFLEENNLGKPHTCSISIYSHLNDLWDFTGESLAFYNRSFSFLL